MVNEEKVRIMTQIALDETKNHKKEISEGEYYKSDYIRSHVISAVWNITVSYFLFVCLAVIYHADYIFVNVARLHYEVIGFLVLGIYAFIVLLSILLSYLIYSKKYIKNKKVLDDYCSKLEELEHFYEQNGEEEVDDTITGA
ncbi:MAG: hypothetical protein SO170_05915 [Butyribacter sp.]|nr:hypothetical protein [bacterium]MDY3854474.1 hypothetical protein [Butyribacter sp.]